MRRKAKENSLTVDCEDTGEKKRVYRRKGGERGGLQPTQNQELIGGVEERERRNKWRKEEEGLKCRNLDWFGISDDG
jgi:hypothetical protein